jgi:hypothetical protein
MATPWQYSWPLMASYGRKEVEDQKPPFSWPAHSQEAHYQRERPFEDTQLPADGPA